MAIIPEIRAEFENRIYRPKSPSGVIYGIAPRLLRITSVTTNIIPAGGRRGFTYGRRRTIMAAYI